MTYQYLEISTLGKSERVPKVRAKLKELRDNDEETFYLLVRSARVAGFVVKRCIFPVEQCAEEHAETCGKVEPYLGLVRTINELRHAEIDPEVRSIIRDSVTKDVLMPSLSFRD